MIEVNLLPGGKKGGGSGGFSFSMPDFSNLFGGGGGGAATDPYQIFFAVAMAIAIGYMGYSFMGVRGEAEELQVRLDEQIQDSLRFQVIIQQTDELTARRDSIARRVDIIQNIDQGRYTWSHLLDQVATAVPDYTWLREVSYVSRTGTRVEFLIGGRAGSLFAVTNFMDRLEISPFLRNVTLGTTSQIPSESNPEDFVFMFELTVTYDPPPLSELESMPLFTEASAQDAAPTTGN